MKLVLKKQVEKLGSSGDIVEVKPGYGRNFLIPHGLALPATDVNIKMVGEKERIEIALKEKEKVSAKALAEKMSAESLTIPVQVGEGDKMFGSVTSIDIAKAFGEKEIEVDRHNILLDEPIKELGVYDIHIKVHHEITATVKVWVVKK